MQEVRARELVQITRTVDRVNQNCPLLLDLIGFYILIWTIFHSFTADHPGPYRYSALHDLGFPAYASTDAIGFLYILTPAFYRA